MSRLRSSSEPAGQGSGKKAERVLQAQIGQGIVSIKSISPKWSGTWGVCLEIECGKEIIRTPVVEPIVLRQRAPSRFARIRSRSASVVDQQIFKLSFDLQNWAIVFEKWNRSKQLTMRLFVRSKNGKESFSAFAFLPLSSLRTSMSRVSSKFIGTETEATISLALGAVSRSAAILVDKQPLPISAFEESEVEDEGEQSDENSGESDLELDKQNSRRMSRRRATSRSGGIALVQIRQAQAKHKWKSLISCPQGSKLDKDATFSRSQVKQILESLGVKLASRDWKELLEDFDPKGEGAITLGAVKSFIEKFDFEDGDFQNFENIDFSDQGEEIDLPKVSSRQVKSTRAKPKKKKASGGSSEVWDTCSFQEVSDSDPSPKSESECSIGGDSNSKEDEEDYAGIDKRRPVNESLEDIKWTEDVLDSVQAITGEIRKAKIKAAQEGRVFNFRRYLQSFADIPTCRVRMQIPAFFEALCEDELRMQQEVVDDLIPVLDPAERGSVNWELLVDMVKTKGSAKASTESSGVVNKALQKIRNAFKRAKSQKISVIDAVELFQSNPNSTLISCRNFEKALKLLGLSLEGKEVKLVANKLKAHAPNTPEGCLDYMLLFDVLGHDLGLLNTTIASRSGVMDIDTNDAISRFRKALEDLSELREEVVDVVEPFKDIDLNGDGTVSFVQFVRGVQKLGVMLPVDDLRAIASQCSVSDDVSIRNSRVDYNKFEMLIQSDDAIAAALRPQMKEAARRGLPALGVFHALDKRDRGAISRADFRKACSSTLGLRIRENQLRYLMKKFSVGDQGFNRVAYADFVNFVCPNGDASLSLQSEKSGLEASIRETIRAASLRHGLIDPETAFAKFDSAGRSYCSRNDFRRGLQRLGVNPSPEDLRELYDRFDPTQSDKVDFGEFVQFAGFSERETDELALKILQRFRQVEETGQSIEDAFMMFDVARNGVILQREFKEVAKMLELPITEKELRFLMRKFAQIDDEDLIHYQDFLRFILRRQHDASVRQSSEALQALHRLENRQLTKSRSHPVVDGNGFDGFYPDRRTGYASSSILGMLAGRGLEIDRSNGCFFDHASQTVNRFVDHAGQARAKRQHSLTFKHPADSFEVPADWEMQWQTPQNQSLRDDALRSVLIDTLLIENKPKSPRRRKARKQRNDKRKSTTRTGRRNRNPDKESRFADIDTDSHSTSSSSSSSPGLSEEDEFQVEVSNHSGGRRRYRPRSPRDFDPIVNDEIISPRKRRGNKK